MLERLMEENQNDPFNIGSNETSPAKFYEADTTVILTITAGAGASSGKGVISFNIQQ